MNTVTGTLTPLENEMYQALKALMSNPHLDLMDLVYLVRERELLGWDGPAVTAWGAAVQAARDVVAKVDSK